LNNNNHIKKQFSINNNTINLSSLDNTLKTISGNRTFNLEKKSYDGKNKHNLNTKYEHLNTYNNQSITKRQNKSLNNDRHKTIYISNKNNSFNKINKYKQIPIYKKKEKEKDPHQLTLSNPNLM
jgi:ABC-type antimicrobial peptide transport system permease subunit